MDRFEAGWLAGDPSIATHPDQGVRCTRDGRIYRSWGGCRFTSLRRAAEAHSGHDLICSCSPSSVMGQFAAPLNGVPHGRLSGRGIISCAEDSIDHEQRSPRRRRRHRGTQATVRLRADCVSAVGAHDPLGAGRTLEPSCLGGACPGRTEGPHVAGLRGGHAAQSLPGAAMPSCSATTRRPNSSVWRSSGSCSSRCGWCSMLDHVEYNLVC